MKRGLLCTVAAVAVVTAGCGSGGSTKSTTSAQPAAATSTPTTAATKAKTAHKAQHAKQHKLVAGHVALVHAVDSVELAAELGKRSPAVQPVLLAVNLAGEATKGGVPEADAPVLARAIAGVANIRLDGLMTMPPPSEDPRPAGRTSTRSARSATASPLSSAHRCRCCRWG